MVIGTYNIILSNIIKSKGRIFNEKYKLEVS